MELPLLGPKAMLGQRIIPRGPVSFLEVQFGTYNKRTKGRVEFRILAGIDPPRSLREIESRTFWKKKIDAGLIRDNDPFRIEIGWVGHPWMDGCYLLLAGDAELEAHPTTVWLDRSESWNGPPADRISIEDGRAKSSPLRGHLSLNLGNDRNPSDVLGAVRIQTKEKLWAYCFGTVFLAGMVVAIIQLGLLVFRRRKTGREVSPALKEEKDGYHQGSKKLLFYLLMFVIFGVVIALLIAGLEFFASFQVTKASQITIKDSRLHHIFTPNGKTIWPTGCGRFADPKAPKGFTHTYNAQGWVMKNDVDREKPRDIYRIFYVGDSFTMGCVPMGEAVADQVGAYLGNRFPDAVPRVEVINTGTGSYSSIIYYILIRYVLIDYQPDLIVINVDMTDNWDDIKYRAITVTDENGDPWAVLNKRAMKEGYLAEYGEKKSILKARLKLWLLENSYLYNWIRSYLLMTGPQGPQTLLPQEDNTVRAQKTGPVYRQFSWCRQEWDQATQEAVAYTLDILGRAIRFCRSKGIKVLLTGVPHYQQYAQGADGRPVWSHRPHDELKRLARRLKVAYLDSYQGLKPFVSGTKQDELYLQGDMHFNIEGNKLWAGLHIKALTDPSLDLLPKAYYRSE